MNQEDAQIEAMLRRDPGLQQEWLRQDNLVFGGLIAGCVLLLQPFLTAASLDLSATIAVVSFSVAIPLLAALVMVYQQEVYRHRPTGLRVLTITKTVGQGVAVLGVAAAFWHILWVAGVAVIASGTVAVLVHAAGYTRLEGIGTSPEQGTTSTGRR